MEIFAILVVRALKPPMSTLPRPTYYCTRCRQIKPMAPSNDALCPTCPEEPLVDVSDPDQRTSVEELEADALDRHNYKWMAGVGVAFGVVGVFTGWILIGLTGVTELFWAGTAGGIFAGVGLGRWFGRRLWARGDRPSSLEEALARASLTTGNARESP
jgi:hypothetical protein